MNLDDRIGISPAERLLAEARRKITDLERTNSELIRENVNHKGMILRLKDEISRLRLGGKSVYK